MLIVGGVIVVVVVMAVVLVLSSGGGGKSKSQGSAGTQGEAKRANTTSGTHTTTRTSSHHSESSVAVAASPAAITVTVLNGTNTNGLAHSLADDLQQSGYLRATALNGSPPGSHTTTVVQYTSGHRAEAQAVSRALEVTQVQPMETAVASLAGASTVVVIAGEDKVAAVP
jgi:hypothetical protein